MSEMQVMDRTEAPPLTGDVSAPYRHLWTRRDETDPDPGPADLREARRELRRFHRLRKRALWRRRTRWQIPLTVAVYAVRTLKVLKSIRKALGAPATTIREAYGLSHLRQLGQMLRVFLTARLSPGTYHWCRLYRPGMAARAGLYVSDFHSSSVHAGLYGWMTAPMTKTILYERGGAAGLPLIPILAICPPNGEPEVLEPDSPLWKADLFTKHDRGGLGSSQRKWSYRPDGSYSGDDGRFASRDELLRFLCDHPKEYDGVLVKDPQPELVQPFVTMHERMSALTSGGLCTVRIYTFSRTGGREPAVMAPAIKLVTGGAIVDNLTGTNNLIAPVDLATGRIGPAKQKGDDGLFHPIERHPDTGVVIEGFELPHWQEALDACVEGQKVFDETPSIGWDVSFTDDGPILVEGNLMWGTAQGIWDAPLGLSPFPKWTADWLEEWFESRDD